MKKLGKILTTSILALSIAASLLAPALAGNENGDGDPVLIAPAPQQEDAVPIDGGAVDQYVDAAGCYSLWVNGNQICGASVMVPLRAVAEAMGYTVTWNGADQPILVDNGVMHTEVTLGLDMYFVTTSNPDLVGMSAPFSLGVPPYCVNGTTYVPLGLFEALEGNVEGMFQVQEDHSIVIDTTVGG